MKWFISLEDARDKVERWRRDYNEFRPHSAITYLTPVEFARKSGLAAVLESAFVSRGLLSGGFLIRFSYTDQLLVHFFIINNSNDQHRQSSRNKNKT